MKGTKGLVLLYSYNLVLKDFEVKQVSRANRSTSYNSNKMPAVLTHESTERSWK